MSLFKRNKKGDAYSNEYAKGNIEYGDGVSAPQKKVAAIIPARLASTRLPRKVLRDIHGKPLIQWVYERTAQAVSVDEVFVATPDKEIIDAVHSFGGRAILTGEQPTVLDRCAEAALTLDNPPYRYVVVVQGDEPMVYPEQVDLVVKEIKSRSCHGVCMVKKLDENDDPWNPNMVKAIIDHRNMFIYLSRSVVPGSTPEKHGKFDPVLYKQVCIMAFENTYLRRFGRMEMGPLERSEGIDLVRYIEHGWGLTQAVESPFDTQAVDTQEDLEKVREMLAEDPYVILEEDRIRGVGGG